MNRGPGGRTDSPPEPPTPRAKPNRLSRSHRQNRAAAGLVFSLPEFKTPTRIPRSRPAGGFNEESPHESDCQQDIIWDASSPSPSRLGRRGKKHSAGVVNISEIVNRIAPKHGRPEAAEPTLQQWIGDSASIPCTPDLQAPKPKKKSPRPNGVDDLLKLAKQFDFNMFRQDEDEPEDVPPQSPELLSKDVLDFRDEDHNSGEPAVNDGTDVQLRLQQQVEDDLNFLFDGPTQHVSGNLSQLSWAQPSQVNADVKPSPGPTGSVSTPNTERTSANDEFEDDWENDDLLNDSLMLEMTQNPQKFTALQHSSTQKPAPPVKYAAPVNVPVSGGVGLGRSAASNVGKENIRQRTSFKLESSPNVSVTRVQTWANPKRGDAQPSRVSSTKVPLTGKVGSEHTGKSEPQKSQFNQRTSFTCSSSAASVPNTSATKPEKPELIASHDAAYDFQDEDLDSFFSLDLVWDDPADDDLLCEVCEDLENQIQSVDNMRVKQSQVSNQRAALQPSRRAGTVSWPIPQKQTSTAVSCASGRPAETSSAGSAPNVKDSFRQTPCTARVQLAAAAPQPTNRGQFTFKKPNILASTAATPVLEPSPPSSSCCTAVAKCSAAEIELKKQQAMERRRQRLQAAQNLPTPT
uniref:ETAA1 activator of ATR kinase a n=1 Tax=Mastacembelus armatus TaxID=205130 RepID=A0A3Q3MIH9_9TELE